MVDRVRMVSPSYNCMQVFKAKIPSLLIIQKECVLSFERSEYAPKHRRWPWLYSDSGKLEIGSDPNLIA